MDTDQKLILLGLIKKAQENGLSQEAEKFLVDYARREGINLLKYGVSPAHLAGWRDMWARNYIEKCLCDLRRRKMNGEFYNDSLPWRNHVELLLQSCLKERGFSLADFGTSDSELAALRAELTAQGEKKKQKLMKYNKRYIR